MAIPFSHAADPETALFEEFIKPIRGLPEMSIATLFAYETSSHKGGWGMKNVDL